jgi:hypothetical protein
MKEYEDTGEESVNLPLEMLYKQKLLEDIGRKFGADRPNNTPAAPTQ